MLHLRHLGEHGLAVLTELFNISVAGVDISAIWKNSVIISILKAGKPRKQDRSYRPISLLCPAAKILERLLLPTIVEALGARPSQQGFKLKYSTTSALIPISATVVSGFNQRKPPSRTIVIAVDIFKAFDTAPQNRTPKILEVKQDTHFTFAPHARDWVERASRALNVIKALTGLSWVFMTENLVATYPNAPPVILGGVLEEEMCPLTRRLLRGRMIAWGVRPVSGAQQGTVGCPPTMQWTQPNSCCLGPTAASVPAPLWLLLTAHVLPPLRRMGR